MNKYGVCYYDFDAYKSKIEDLHTFEKYTDAVEYYITKLKETEYYIDKTLWIVWINIDNEITQFEQITIKTKCKIIKI